MDNEESADMTIIVCHAAVTAQPAKSAMKKAWSRRVSEERKGSRLARGNAESEVQPAGLPVERGDVVKEVRVCVQKLLW